MNREIKFRAYYRRFSDDNWAIEGEYTLQDLTERGIQFCQERFEWAQYTGLEDKNGKEIYEGDILDCQDRIVKVVWHNEAGCFDSAFVKYIFSLCSNEITNQDFKYRAVVIGNIHENPELISNQ